MLPINAQPTPTLAPSPVYDRDDMGVYVVGQNGSTLYGERADNAHWSISADDGATWSDEGTGPADSFGAGHRAIEVIPGGVYLFALSVPANAAGAGSPGTATGTAKVWRSATLTGTWTDITPGDQPADTVGRPFLLAYIGDRLFYGNYGLDGDYAAGSPGDWPDGIVWRSTAADGTGLTAVMTAAGGRHVHAIAADPADATRIAVTVGDSGGSPGTWFSSNGGTSFTERNTDDRYGIGLVWGADSLVMEGDGPNEAHVLQLPLTALTGSTTDTRTLIPAPDSKPLTDATTWRGTARSIFATAEGNLFFTTTGEDGAVGARYGAWLAKAPDWRKAVLLEEFADAPWDFPVGKVGRTYESGDWLLTTRFRIRRPRFTGQ